MLRADVSLWCSSPCAHRALIAVSTCFPDRLPFLPFTVPGSPGHGKPEDVTSRGTSRTGAALAPALMLCLAWASLQSAALPILWFLVSRCPRRTRGLAPEILAHLRSTERSRRAQGTREHPPALRKVQASLIAVQIRTTARQPRPGVRNQVVPGRDEAEQAGFGRTLPAAHAGAHRRHAPRGPRGWRGRSACHSTAPVRPQRRAPRPRGGPRRHRRRARRAHWMRQRRPHWVRQPHWTRWAGHRT